MKVKVEGRIIMCIVGTENSGPGRRSDRAGAGPHLLENYVSGGEEGSGRRNEYYIDVVVK